MYYLIALLIAGIIAAIPPTFRALCRFCIAPFITPAGHARFGQYRDTEAFRSLERDHYSVTPDWSSDAVRSIEKA